MARSDFVQVRLPVPWRDPIECHEALAAAGLQSFLLTGAGPHPEARWSFLAATPHVRITYRGGDVTEEYPDGAIVYDARPPLEHLAAWSASLRTLEHEEVPFTGGLVGYFGQGFASECEPTLPRRSAETPDAALAVVLDAVAFDHHTHTATLFAADLAGDRAAAQARADHLARTLSNAPAIRETPSAPLQWHTDWDQPGFTRAVARARHLIHDGDLFQVNLAVRHTAASSLPPAVLLRRLRAANPAAYMALLPFPGHTVVSGSPEQLFAAEGGRIRARPIAGTRKRGADAAADAAMEAELRTDAKERSEHLMLVDLVRNDLARVCRPGTVAVTELASVERYRHVMHLASRVEGELRGDAGFTDWLRALFPGGTVTGAPKVRACQRIGELEPSPRGPYTGSAGFLSWSHNAHWSILIRGAVLFPGRIDVHAGSGIVADSQPDAEWKEAHRKARGMLEAVAGDAAPGGARLGEVARHGDWHPPRAAPMGTPARVLLIDNFDSFVHNLADYCAALGATVRTLRNDGDWRAAVEEFHPTHAILSPGPGWPSEAGCTLTAAKELSGHVALLGVCLGHQALAEAFGGGVHVHPSGPVHGRSEAVLHDGTGIFAGEASPMDAMRYHSLAVTPPPGWQVLARLTDGTVMAMRHPVHPTIGLQFHPESVGTPAGMRLLAAWLATSTHPEPLSTQPGLERQPGAH